MDARFQPFLMLGAPLLAMAVGFWLSRIVKKNENKEVIEELLRLREYNQQLLKSLSKEKEVMKGIRGFLNEVTKE